MIDFLTAMLGEARSLVLAAVGVGASLYVAGVWWRTRALVPTLSAIAMAGVVLWAVGNVDVIEAQIDADSSDWLGDVAPAA